MFRTMQVLFIWRVRLMLLEQDSKTSYEALQQGLLSMKSPHSYNLIRLPSVVLLEVQFTSRWGRKSSRWQSARAAKLSGKEGKTACGSCISGLTLMTSTCSNCIKFGQQPSCAQNCHPAAPLAAGIVSLLGTLASAAQGNHPARFLEPRYAPVLPISGVTGFWKCVSWKGRWLGRLRAWWITQALRPSWSNEGQKMSYWLLLMKGKFEWFCSWLNYNKSFFNWLHSQVSHLWKY